MMNGNKISIAIENIQMANKIKFIAIGGILDTLTTVELAEVLNPLIAQKNNILVDCSQLSYINSTGLALLIRYHIQGKRRGASFKIVNPASPVFEVMNMSGATKLLEIYEDKETALDSLQSL